MPGQSSAGRGKAAGAWRHAQWTPAACAAAAGGGRGRETAADTHGTAWLAAGQGVRQSCSAGDRACHRQGGSQLVGPHRVTAAWRTWSQGAWWKEPCACLLTAGTVGVVDAGNAVDTGVVRG